MQSNSNARASLLSGLRTGGVRSASQPTIVPHTAAIGGSFNQPRFPSFSQQHQHHYVDEEVDELADLAHNHLHLNGGGNHRMMPATAALDGSANRFQQQQQSAFLQHMAAQRSANGMGIPGLGAMDPMQMQLMQMELLKLQAIQQAQLQAELIAQNQRQQQQLQLQQQQQQQQQHQAVRRSSTFGEPATAGPAQTSFDLRSSFARESYGQDELPVPKTAALNGKFGGRPILSALNPNASVFTMSNGADEPPTPKTAIPGSNGRTTVISGGTSLGGISTTQHAQPRDQPPPTPSKSDFAMSWRRPSAVAGAPSTPTRPTAAGPPLSSPATKLAPKSDDSTAPSPLRQRPSPLRVHERDYNANNVEAESSADSDVGNSSTSDEKDSSPSTPPSAGSGNSLTREEASKRLYEGLGMGRPIHVQVPQPHVKQVAANQVKRQPRGPPASVDELGSLNFAARKHMVMVGEY